MIVNSPTRRSHPTRQLDRSRRLTVSVLVILLAVSACTATEPSADPEAGATVTPASNSDAF